MFTGIIEKVAMLTNRSDSAQESHLVIATGFTDLALGESIAVNGVCLTVADFDKTGNAHFHVSRETNERTNLRQVLAQSRVNLERALRLGDRLSGHWVQGHVDTTARLEAIVADGDCFRLRITLDPSWISYCVAKGSLAVNGVSLTINSLTPTGVLEFQLVPHTWKETNFSSLQAGDLLNIEVDILAKYMEQLCRSRVPSNT